MTDVAPGGSLPSKLFQLCLTFYERLDEQAVDYGDNRLFRGFVSNEYKNLGLPMPYYTKVVQTLKDMACIGVMARGAVTQESVWVLFSKPDLETYQNTKKTHTDKFRVLSEKIQKLDQRVSRLEEGNGRDT